MKRRTRLISGLITLAAMSFSLVEAVWASTCDPSMDMGTPEAGALKEPMPAMSMDNMDMDMDMNMDGGGDYDGPRSDTGRGPVNGDQTPDCPFGLPGSLQGCGAAASMPASTALVSQHSALRAALLRRIESGPLAAPLGSIFHPPKF